LQLAAGAAPILLVTLEDLWLETEPQNVPGTKDERPNWRRRCRHTLDEIQKMTELIETLRAVDAGRRGGAT
jgi:4-alpha-glucanotransferase